VGRGRQISEFQASLAYRVSSRTTKKPGLEKQKKNKKKKQKTCVAYISTMPYAFKGQKQNFLF
jgi:hypothetical protein